MSKHLLGTKFDTLGRITAEILVILYIHPLIFLRFYNCWDIGNFIHTPLNFSEILSLISKVFINIHEYGYYIICIFNYQIKLLCSGTSLVPCLVIKDEMLLRYDYFLYLYPQSLQSASWIAMETMKFQKPKKNIYFLGQYFFTFKWFYWTNLYP